ncbi:MAG: pentapeptide repeat-containing protein [Pseudomonadota bacterium]
MKRVLFLLICLACAAIGFAAKATLENAAIAQFLRDNALVIAIILVAALAGLGIVLIAGYLYARARLRKLLNADGPLTEAQIAEGLVDHFTTPDDITKPTAADRQRAALVNAGAWLMRRQATQFYFNVTVTVMGGLIGTATLFLLYEQNQKIDLQNEKITLQTDASIAQSVLLEGARRAAFAGDMATLFADIRSEVASKPALDEANACLFDVFVNCWQTNRFEDERNAPSTIKRYRPSLELAARINAFARRNIPYRLAVSDQSDLSFDDPLRQQFGFPNLSPERGQLFETLALNEIYIGTFDFSAAQLTNADLRQRDLSFAQLANADLQSAFLVQTHLANAELAHANLAIADLRRAVLVEANLDESNLRNTNLEFADLSKARLVSADLRSAYLARARFTNALMNGANFDAAKMNGAFLRGAILTNATLRGAEMDRAILIEAKLVGANLHGAFLRGSNLFRSTLERADLTEADLRNAYLGEAEVKDAIFNGANLAGAWAWEDMQPKNLPPAVQITLCTYIPTEHYRFEKPNNC